MINIEHAISLKTFNTLSAPSQADNFFELNSIDEIPEIISYAEQKDLNIQMLGGGSNVILPEHIGGLVVKNNLRGKQVVSQDHESAMVVVQAGENWHSFIEWCLDKNLYGLENLALIPGTVGASPVQNIGAYGVEVGQWIHSVHAFDTVIGEQISFDQSECVFQYRDSKFKKEENRYLITEVVFNLSKSFQPVLDYGPLKMLKARADLTAREVFNKVVEIRQSKLPDPESIPNAGSFFKNPIVDEHLVAKLKADYPNLVFFPHGDQFKLAAGWLIDQAGLKGKSSESGVGCYEKQALVLVNPTGADSKKVLAWAAHVQQEVKNRFYVTLEIEPRQWA